MNTSEEKDKALKKLLQQPHRVKLSSNFVYQTMLKVDQAAIVNERREERRLAWATGLTALSMVLISILFIGFSVGFVKLYSSLQNSITQITVQVVNIPYLFIPIILLVILFFDQWMRSYYWKHHRVKE